MGRYLGLDAKPNEYLAYGEEWPEGRLVADAPSEAHMARHLSSRFRRVLEDEGLDQKQASQRIGISTHTVNDLYHGKSWPSFVVVARVEQGLGVTLWDGAYELTDEPDEAHRQPPVLPNSYLAQGESWPYGDLVDDAPAEARLAKAIAKNVLRALKSRGWSDETASDKLKLPIQTIRDVYKGERWVSFAVIARMDDHFDFPLWASSRRMAAGSQ